MNGFEKFIRAIVGIIVFAIWAVIGLLYWIPMLIKATILYSIDIIRSAVSSGKGNAIIKRNLSVACGFYIEGYKKIWNVLFSNKTDKDDNKGGKRKGYGISELVMETIFTIVFWLTIVVPFFIIGILILLIIDICIKYTKDGKM